MVFKWINRGAQEKNKSSLMRKVEGPTPPVANTDLSSACITDGMAIVRQAKVSGLTFWEFAKQLLKTVVAIGKSSRRIDVALGQYEEHSIKNAERIRRSSTQLLFKKIISYHPIKQWTQFLCSVLTAARNRLCD